MLEDTHCISKKWAWWSDGNRPQALNVLARSSKPASSGVSFFIPDFALTDPEPWLVGDECPWPSVSPSPLPAVESRREVSTYADFQAGFSEIQSQIRDGLLQKVVPLVAEELHFAAALHAAHFPSAFAPRVGQYGYGFEFGEEGFCGLTPEVLFEVQDGILSTMALAGTGPMDGPSLLTIPKERVEHQLVIEHIDEELKTLGSVEIGKTVERAYGRLKHLFTPIRVVLDRMPDFMDLVTRLHPTAALGGWPRANALAWLEKQDFHRYRRRFGAPFGYLRVGGEMRCVVAIRGLQWVGRRALLAAGCGVVAQSHLDGEWRELKLKLSAIEQNLGLSR
jgi:menaquinone-specific isochorismate synthase